MLSKQQSKSKDNRIIKDDKKLKYKTESFIKQKQRANLTQDTSLQQNSIKFKKFQPINRKSYGDLIKSTLFEDFNIDDPSKSIDSTTTKSDDLKLSSSTEKLDDQFINFKLLEKKSEQEREKLSNLMKKLEIDLMKAKMDLMEDDYIKTTPISLVYPNICVTSQNSNGKSPTFKPLPSQVYNHTQCLSSSSTSSASNSNKEIKPVNKYLLSASYSSSASTSSGIVASTGPLSSSSSSVSASPPLDKQQFNQTDNNETKNDDLKSSKNVKLLLINRPRKLPKRRHTIGSSYDSIVTNKMENYSSISSSSSYLSSGDDNYTTKIIDDNNHDCNDADDDDDIEMNGQRKKKLIKSINKENLDDQLCKIITSKSINYLPSLTFGTNSNILFPGPLETKNITKRRTSSRKKSLYSSMNTTNNSNKKVILNLSSLSMSASSITSSSSASISDEKNNELNEISSKSISKITLSSREDQLSKNYDDNNSDSIKLDNFLKQNNIKFNCTFESLI